MDETPDPNLNVEYAPAVGPSSVADGARAARRRPRRTDASKPGPSAGEAASAKPAPEPAAGQLEPIPEIDHYELDGVPLFHLPSPGSTMLALEFRVGQADEPVPLRGITHLAEHLVMSAVAGHVESANGTTSSLNVSFHVRGTPGEAAAFLRDVCHAIQRPNLSRMGQEANVLRTEASGRGAPGLGSRMIWQRAGFQGLGTVILPELFLRTLDERQQAAWIAEHLVQGNAAIWIAGPLPDELLIDLPPGPRVPPPALSWIPGFETPTLVVDEIPGIAASFFVDRTVATKTAFRTLNRRLTKALRVDRGLGYEVGDDYLPVSAEQALAVIWATCLPDSVGQVQRVVLDTLDVMGQAGATDEELEQQHGRLVRELSDPASFPGRLANHTRDVLLGANPEPAAEIEEQYWRLRSDEVAGAMRTALQSEVLVLPANGTRPQRPFKPYPGPTILSMGEGHEFPLASDQRKVPWGKPTTPRLFVGTLGVAVDHADGRRMSAVRWDECVGVVQDLGPARTILGRDGYRVSIDAREWRDGSTAVKLIDRFAPSAMVVPPG